VRTRKLSYSEAVDFLSKGFAEVGITISREEIEDVVRELDGIIGWVSPRRLPVDSCRYLWIYFLASGFPALGRVLIPPSAGLSGLHVTLEPLICFNPSPASWGQPHGVAEPSSMRVHRGFESVRCLTWL
jgi:hypothetical protein